MAEDRLNDLVERYANNSIGPEEFNELWQLLAIGSPNSFSTSLRKLWQASANALQAMADEEWNQKLSALLQKAEEEEQERSEAKIYAYKSWKRWLVAACMVGVIIIGYLIFTNKQQAPQPSIAAVTPNDVPAPATAKATITLSNGEIIYLDSAANGQLAQQTGVNLIKNNKGEIVYQPKEVVANIPLTYNTLVNPRGSKVVSITLADGSKVWLNSESSITYPVAFIGYERRVVLKGEAYFEVRKISYPDGEAKEGAKFIVEANGVSTEVLGTHFNVNSYADEPAVKITLLEGSVNVKRESSTVKLKPGEQAVAMANAPLSIQHSPDLEEVMAWKNGLFQFNGADLQAVVRQLARWYDLEVKFQGQLPPRRFAGKLQRSLSLTEVLDGLSLNQMHYTIEGRHITIKP